MFSVYFCCGLSPGSHLSYKGCAHQAWLEGMRIIMLYFSIPRWKQPRKLNGILERYLLYISNHMHDFTVWDVVYNSTELFQDHTLQYLLPGTKYLLKLGVSLLFSITFSVPFLSLLLPFPLSHLLSLPHLRKQEQTQKTLRYRCSHWKFTSSLNVNDVDLIHLFHIIQNDRITI